MPRQQIAGYSALSLRIFHMDDNAAARWIDLEGLNNGDGVVFEFSWVIPIRTTIPASTRCVVTSQRLDASDVFSRGYLGVMPVTPLPGVDLCKWNGEIRVSTRMRRSAKSPLRIT